ncbi:MAG TPA: kelch repeat-containing protein [Bacteroidia bacterium]|nr:kelch repeat-containing protein [Bacteroidia bacterium]HRH08419.1 kelch repeat-containing protein [Bacteroidia bacterium]HRH64039.1 kelch repeat-containing protein [Bacteroidia bacterium]
MKRILFLFFGNIFFTLLSHAQVWQQIADFIGTERDDGVSFTIGNYTYCGSGLKTGWSLSCDFYRFAPLSEQWVAIAPMPVGNERQYATAFSYNGNGYVCGGTGFGALSDCWQYLEQSNTWQQKTSRPGNGFSGSASFVIGNKAYIIGGSDGTTSTNEVWMYDLDNDTWTSKNNFPLITSWRASAVAANGKGYLLFGKDSSDTYNSLLYEYDSTLDAWKILSNFPGRGRVYSSMQALGNNLMVFGGIDSLQHYSNDLWYYSLADSTWHQQISLPSQGRKGGMCFTNATTLYYTCGIDSTDTRLKQTWKIANPIGFQELIKNKVIKVYPTICSNEVIIEWHSTSEFEWKLFNSYHAMVASNRSNASITKINVQELQSGMYFLQLVNQNECSIQKIMVE